MNILLRSPLFSSFSFLFSGSHLPSLSHPPFFRLDISSFVLSSIHFSCSLVYFMSNLFAAIQRASALLRHYPEIPKLLQTLSAPELKNYRHFSAGVHLEQCSDSRIDWSKSSTTLKLPFRFCDLAIGTVQRCTVAPSVPDCLKQIS